MMALVRAAACIGLVGCGSWGKHILRDLAALECQVAVVARSDRSRANAEAGGAATIVRSVGELPDVEGVVVATPTATHPAAIDEALGLGVPVFVEKPLTNDAEAADRIAAAAPDRVFVMDKWRYHPGVELLGEIARSEELGPVSGLRTTRIGWGNPHEDVDAVWTLAPHDLSIALEILGSVPEPRSAVADGLDGIATGLVAMLGESPWYAFEVSSRAARERREITLVCEEGIATLADGYSDAVQVVRGRDPRKREDPDTELRAISSELPLLRELQAFVEHVRGGPPPRSSAAEGAAIVRTITELRALAGLSS
jgi:predicted dehydrogenase